MQSVGAVQGAFLRIGNSDDLKVETVFIRQVFPFRKKNLTETLADRAEAYQRYFMSHELLLHFPVSAVPQSVEPVLLFFCSSRIDYERKAAQPVIKTSPAAELFRLPNQ